MQKVCIVYKKKKDIVVLKKRKEFDVIAVDFKGNFIEEKAIYADLSNSIKVNTSLNNVSGTLFIKNDNFEDLILELE